MKCETGKELKFENCNHEKKILIVEDQFIETNNLQMILEKEGYKVCAIAGSVPIALELDIILNSK